MALEESKTEQQARTVNGIDLLIAEGVMPYTQGKQIDYISNSYGQGFAIEATGGGCGC